MANLKLIEEITNAFGPSGFEEEVCRVIKNFAEGFDITNDAMCNLYMKRNDHSGDKPVLLLDAHSDECGFMVQNIRENGLLDLVCLGGIHLTNIPAHSVIVRNGEGRKFRGITTSKPVHFLRPEEKGGNLAIEDLAVDVGASSRDEVINVYGIRPGDPIVPDVTFEYQNDHGICYGKAFDNRLGCACIVETMKALQNDKNLAVDVVGGFATQEEVGTRGATVTSQQIHPDLAIVFEGSPADDFYYSNGNSQGALKKGVQIRRMDVSYISNPVFVNYAHTIGDTYGIKYQDAVRRGGGTNAGKISLEGKAVPVLVLGIPSRYVHTPYNFCAMEDIDATIRMATEIIRNLNETTLDKILRKDILR